MYNDLISRSKTIKRLRMMGNPHNNFIETNIKLMPDAYDIDEVLNQLKMNKCIASGKLEMVEKIIKNGGVNEKR